jgi:hypothetical protein
LNVRAGDDDDFQLLQADCLLRLCSDPHQQRACERRRAR